MNLRKIGNTFPLWNEIRNSTAEFLTFVAEGKENGIQVLYKDETIWATQKAMAALFDVGIPAINKHLTNIFAEGELKKEATVSKMEIVQTEGNREVYVLFPNPYTLFTNCKKSPFKVDDIYLLR